MNHTIKTLLRDAILRTAEIHVRATDIVNTGLCNTATYGPMGKKIKDLSERTLDGLLAVCLDWKEEKRK